MNTNVITKIECKLDELDFGYWDNEGEVFVGISESPEDVKSCFGLSDEAVGSITMFVAEIKELVGTDLRDIWMRLEYVEEKAFD